MHKNSKVVDFLALNFSYTIPIVFGNTIWLTTLATLNIIHFFCQRLNLKQNLYIAKIFATKIFAINKILNMNPFKFGTIVENEFFTDRKEESEILKQKLDSENHVILISPRRLGKSSLVQKVVSELNQPYIKIDLQYVMNVSDFAAQLLKSIFKLYPYEKIKYTMGHFRVVPTISTNAVTGAMDVSFQSGNNSAIMLEDAMEMLEKVATSKSRLIVILDEFQEVTKIQEGFDRQLRSIMQQQKGINYIMLGSQESLMEDIFEKKKSPFYHFGQMMRLSRIPRTDFSEYIMTRLPKIADNKAVSITNNILDFTKCHPYYTQQLAAHVWELVNYQEVTDNVVSLAIEQLIKMHDLDFERLWISMNRTDREILLQIATGENPLQNRQKPTSTSFSAIKRLMRDGYIINIDKYEIEDPFFMQWIINKNL